jgi:hypothetical protein
MNIKKAALITLTLGLALSTSINFCMDYQKPSSEQEQRDTSYFGWRSKAAILRQKLFGSPYPMQGAAIGAAVSTAISSIAAGAMLLEKQFKYYSLGFTKRLPDIEISRFTSDFARTIALPIIVGGTIAGIALGLMKQQNIDAAPALKQAADEAFPKVMPLVIDNMNRLMSEAVKIQTFEQYEASPYKNVFKQIGDLKFEKTTLVTEEI